MILVNILDILGVMALGAVVLILVGAAVMVAVYAADTVRKLFKGTLR